MLLVPGCIEPETASTFLNQQPDPRSCVNPGPGSVIAGCHQGRSFRQAKPAPLPAKSGHGVDDWPLVILKELVDNGIAASEGAGIAPKIPVTGDTTSISVADNSGPRLEGRMERRRIRREGRESR